MQADADICLRLNQFGSSEPSSSSLCLESMLNRCASAWQLVGKTPAGNRCLAFLFLRELQAYVRSRTEAHQTKQSGIEFRHVKALIDRGNEYNAKNQGPGENL